MINHIKRWWYWQKQNGNSFFYKILVLFRIAHSPTFNHIWTPDEAKAFYDGFMEGFNNYKGDEDERYSNEDK